MQNTDRKHLIFLEDRCIDGFFFLLTSLNVSRGQLSSVVKMNSDEFTLRGKVVNLYFKYEKINYVNEWSLSSATTNTHKSRGVVIPDGLGITKGLQSRVSLDDLILQGTLL